MNSDTSHLIDALQSATLFSECGKPLYGRGAADVSSLRDAITISTSKEAENAQLESANLMSEFVLAKDVNAYRQRKAFVKEFRPIVEDLVGKNIVAGRPDFKRTETYVFFDLLNLLIESEYSCLLPKLRFRDRGEWYLAGRFPCGWDGDFPEGRLFVF